jgi:hypothetical protein
MSHPSCGSIQAVGVPFQKFRHQKHRLFPGVGQKTLDLPSGDNLTSLLMTFSSMIYQVDNQRVTIVTIIDSIPLNLIKSDLIPVKS